MNRDRLAALIMALGAIAGAWQTWVETQKADVRVESAELRCGEIIAAIVGQLQPGEE